MNIDKNLYLDADASLCTVLSLSSVFILGELLLLLRQNTTNTSALYSLFSHTIACFFLLKLVVDGHPVSHFWVCFFLFNVPTLLNQIYTLLSSFNKQKIFYYSKADTTKKNTSNERIAIYCVKGAKRRLYTSCIPFIYTK